MIPGVETPIPARAYAPDAQERCPVMLYFHGGGYVKGGIGESDAFCRNLARVTRSGAVDRLSPWPPNILSLPRSTMRWPQRSGRDPRRRLGRRTGSCRCVRREGIWLRLCLRLRANPDIAIRHQVLLQPVVDFTLSFPSIAMPASECLVPREDLAWYYRTYRGDQCDPRDPRVSPIFADDSLRLPPALIIAAEYDTLRDEAEAYARFEVAGVATRYICADGMVHGFLQMRGLVPDAQAAAGNRAAP
jgi:acetyl esterase